MITELNNLTTLRVVKDFISREYDEMGYGCTRTVYNMSENTVVKVPIRTDYVRYNKAEVDYYKNHPNARHLLGKIIDHHPDYLWLIMEKGKPCGWATEYKLKYFKNRLKKLCPEIIDVYYFNIASFRGRYKIIDYAMYERK